MGSMTSTIASKLAFFPPEPPSYDVTEEGGKLIMTEVSDNENVDVMKIETKMGTHIVAIYVKNMIAEMTVLYSHGNATDIGRIYDLFIELSLHLRVNLMGDECATFVVLIDHTAPFVPISETKCATMPLCMTKLQLDLNIRDQIGYGKSTGKASELNSYGDIEAAYKFLQDSYGAKEEDIILYGQSVGSGPTIDLASRLPRLRGVVLQSPIASGLRVMYPVKHTYWCDMYKNVDKIPFIECPVFVIHGTDDDAVDISHGKELAELCKHKYEPLWINGGNHCDLELYPEYIKHLKKFIAAIDKSSHYSHRRTHPSDRTNFFI